MHPTLKRFVISKFGYATLGTGTTREEAIADARRHGVKIDERGLCLSSERIVNCGDIVLDDDYFSLDERELLEDMIEHRIEDAAVRVGELPGHPWVYRIYVHPETRELDLAKVKAGTKAKTRFEKRGYLLLCEIPQFEVERIDEAEVDPSLHLLDGKLAEIRRRLDELAT